MPFNIAISGLNAASSDLNVIGNNVANASTTGFKKARVEFADVYAATSMGLAVSVPVGSSGLGTRVTGVKQEFSQGTIAYSDRAMDLAISGSGFFILDDQGSNVYSRDGAFGLDREGFLSNGKGQKVIGYQVGAANAITGVRGPLQISAADAPPKATSTINLEINLNASAASIDAATVPFDPADSDTYHNATSVQIYDSLGNSHLSTMYYRKVADNSWESYVYVDGASVAGPDTLEFSDTGDIINPANGQVAVNYLPPGATAMTLTYDYSDSTQHGGSFALTKLNQDGHATGKIAGIDIDANGQLIARYTNGQSLLKGQLALATFPNPTGLIPLGDTGWAESFNSGDALVSTPNSSGMGLIQAGALEQSNVELSEELVELIIAQRNYQANAEVISVADEATQSIINIR
jgi:flagellar hook protein FlgE